MDWMEALAPAAWAESWDRVGLHIGDPDRNVERVLLALTVTEDVVAQAEAFGAELIVSHHPVLFRPLGELRWDRPAGRLIRRLVRAGIDVYSAHTNFDAADRGTSVILARRLGLEECRALVPAAADPSRPRGMGCVGRLPEPLAPADFLDLLRRELGLTHVRHAGPLPAAVARVAVMGGSGGSFLRDAAAAEADAYVTGDVDYHDALEAVDRELWVIDAGHFATERLILPFWQAYLSERAEAAGARVDIRVARESDPFRVVAFGTQERD